MPTNPRDTTTAPRSMLHAPASPAPSTARSVRSSAQSTSPGGPAGHIQGSSPGWQSVGSVQGNKFAMKRSPGKKFLEAGESVICIHNKVIWSWCHDYKYFFSRVVCHASKFFLFLMLFHTCLFVCQHYSNMIKQYILELEQLVEKLKSLLLYS